MDEKHWTSKEKKKKNNKVAPLMMNKNGMTIVNSGLIKLKL